MMTKKETRWRKGAVALGLVVLLLAALFGNMSSERSVNASKETDGVWESNEVKTAAGGSGNGPGTVTSLKDFGISRTEVVPNYGTDGATITDSQVSLVNKDNASFLGTNTTGYKANQVRTNASVPLSMKHSWKLKLLATTGRHTLENRGGVGLNIYFTDNVNNLDFTLVNRNTPSNVKEFQRWINFGNVQSPTAPASTDFGVSQPVTISYNADTNKLTATWTETPYTITVDNPFSKDEIKVYFQAQLFWTDGYTVPSDPADNSYTTTKVIVDFQSFEYTDFYMKAKNHLTDYAGRKITGAVGNGQTIGIHPTMLNNETKTQRYSGTISLNSSPGPENILPLPTSQGADITQNPLTYNMTGNASVETPFDAKVKTTAPYTSGQKFRLPLLINEDYFSTSALSGLSGVPGTWHNLQHDKGDGPKPQLPIQLNIERDTCRELVGSKDVGNAASGFDYEYTIDGKRTKANDNGWYNKNVTVTIKSNPDEFNELNFSTASGDDKIKPANIKFTARTDSQYGSSESFIVGGSSAGGESPDLNGDTYRIFGRKGTDTETADLSAVTTDTFRIDKTKPSIGSFDRSNRTLMGKDNLSGIDYMEYKHEDDAEYTKVSLEHYTAAGGLTAGYTDRDYDLPEFTKTGNYTIRLTDMAGNVSEPQTISNTAPVITASDKTMSFTDTISGLAPAGTMNASVKDTEEGDIPNSRLAWKIEKENFNTVTGVGEDELPSYLPAGKYKVTFTLNGTGADVDGNKPKAVTVTLIIQPDGPPDITDKESSSGGNVPGNIKTNPSDGTKHYYAEDETIIIVDPSDLYNGGRLTADDAAAEIKRQFGFDSKLPSPADKLEATVMLQDEDGNDITGDGYIDTSKAGKYKFIYTVTDLSGCSTTLEMTYIVKENVTVTFHSGKGDYKDGTTERTAVVKVNQSPKAEDVPAREDLLAPAKACFIGWGTKINGTNTVKPETIALGTDTTYYAIYVADLNENQIPDSEEAIFYFVSSDPDHAAYKYADKTTIGILAPQGMAVTLNTGQIPELLFDRATDISYRVKGYKTDATGDQLLTEAELCALGRRAGTVITVTAVIEEYSIKDEGKVTVTFFSSEPKSSPLDGGEGQLLELDAPDPGQPVTIPKEKLPEVKLGEDCELEGWKTSDTGDLILPEEAVTSKELYGGREITCIAYVEPPKKEPVKVPDKTSDKTPEKEVVVKEKGVSKETVVNKNTVKKSVVKQKEETKKAEVTFIFNTSRAKSGVIATGDGTAVILPAMEGNASIAKRLVPELKLKEGNSFAGWKTSFTGNRLLTTEELCSLSIPSGTTVICTACFRYKEISIEDTEVSENSKSSSKGALTTIKDSLVPLGSRPGSSGGGERNNPSCIVHFIMLSWLFLALLTILWRLHYRKKREEFLYPDPTSAFIEFRTAEDYESLADSLRTGPSDYLFLAGVAVFGVILYTWGSCALELPILLIGLLACLYHLLRLKVLDRKERKALKKAAEGLK